MGIHTFQYRPWNSGVIENVLADITSEIAQVKNDILRLESDRTLNVESANDGITVNADNIQLNVVDNLTSTSATQPLSANQGKMLDAAKVDKITGKGLSTEDYTTDEKSKVANFLQTLIPSLG